MATTNPEGNGWIVAATGPGYVTITPANSDLNYAITNNEDDPNLDVLHVFKSRTDRSLHLADGEVLQVNNPTNGAAFALTFTATNE